MTPHPSPLPETLDPAFRVATALAIGTSASRLRAKDLDSPFWGVRTRAPRDREATSDGEARRRVLDLVPRMTPEWFFMLQSAALLWRIPIPPLVGEPVHVGVLAPRRLPRANGLRGHKVAPDLVSLRTLEGIRVTSPASTWAQLGSVLSIRDLVAAGCGVIRIPRLDNGRPGDPASALGTIDELRAAAAAGRRVGVGRLRQALPLIRPGISSRPEAHLMLDLDDGILPVPELDYEVRGPTGVLLGISEIAYPEHKVAVEYEGDHHRTSKRQWNRDIDKYRAYVAAGWTPVRVTSENQYGTGIPPRALVLRALQDAGWSARRAPSSPRGVTRP